MIKIPRLTTFVLRSVATAVGFALIAGCLAMPVRSQSPGTDARPKEQEKDQPRREGTRPEAKPDAPKPGDKGDKQAKPAPEKDGNAPAGADKAEKGGKDSTEAKLSRPPQTAAEKARRLQDLYAQLATAEDEETAKRFSSAIERLWTQSGSDTVSLLLDRAAQAQKKKKLELAKKLYDHVVSLAPDFPEGFNQRAYFNFTQNNYEAAVGDLRRVLALDPNHYKALEGLAQIWRETGNKKAAYGVMKRLMDVHPHAPGAKAIYEELKRDADGQAL